MPDPNLIVGAFMRKVKARSVEVAGTALSAVTKEVARSIFIHF
jgi:hypothetical protein